MIRILIVDDSPTARLMLAEILGSDPDIEVVGTAKNGREAVEMTIEKRPDLITMDIHMPVMNGFDATREIMIECPTPIVIVSASTMANEVADGMQVLRAGALTLMLKPSGPASPNFDREARELIETVKAMSELKVIRHHRRNTPKPAAPVATGGPPKFGDRTTTGYRAIAIASSTGGPPALSDHLLKGLPHDFPVPILLVQHIAAGFDEGFASWLDSVVPLSVKIAQEGEYLKPGAVYVAGLGRQLSVTRGGRVSLSDDPPIGGFKPAATHLYDSVAQAFDDKVITVILTGMGCDGVEGLRAVKRKGGYSIAQDEETSVVWGMPGAAVSEGLVDIVLPINRIAQHLLDLVARDIN